MRIYETPKIKISLFSEKITTHDTTASLVSTLAATYTESVEKGIKTKIYSVDFQKAIEFK